MADHMFIKAALPKADAWSLPMNINMFSGAGLKSAYYLA